MLSIVICDNEQKLIKSYAREIDEAIEKDNLDAEVLLTTTNPDEIKAFFIDKNGLFFVMLELLYDSGAKGVDIAKKIRESDRDSYIVFVTKYILQMHTVFEGLIRPSGFLSKPVNRKELIAVFLNAYCDHTNFLQKEDCYNIAIGSRLYRLPLRSIYYFEAAQKKIFINTDTQRIGYYDSLEAIGKRLASNAFVRCHKGFIVNVTKVARVDFSEMFVFLTNGAAIPLSRTYKDAFKNIGL